MAVGDLAPPDEPGERVVARLRREQKRKGGQRQAGGDQLRHARGDARPRRGAVACCERACKGGVNRPADPASTLRGGRMKLIIQIPCYDEEQTLPETLGDLPREVPGVDEVEWLVIDDGSTDRTVEVARAARRRPHRAPHQQPGAGRGIPGRARRVPEARRRRDREHRRRQPVLRRRHPEAASRRSSPARPTWSIGDRETDQIEHFSPLKKRLQRLGSAVVRRASGTNVPDTTSGFRAYNREAALQMQVVSKFTYTLETIIQAGKQTVAIDHVPIRTNPTDARVAPVPVDVAVRAPQHGLDLPHLLALRAAAACSSPPRSSPRSSAPSSGSASCVFVIAGRERRPHPVADPRLDAVHRRRAVRRARRARRHPRRLARAPAAHPRARAARRAAPRASSPRTTSPARPRPARRPPPAPRPAAPPARPRSGRR